MNINIKRYLILEEINRLEELYNGFVSDECRTVCDERLNELYTYLNTMDLF